MQPHTRPSIIARLRTLLMALALLLTPLLSLASATSALAASPGTVVAWGDNTYGQSTIPANLSGVTAIAAGGAHSSIQRALGCTLSTRTEVRPLLAIAEVY